MKLPEVYRRAPTAGEHAIQTITVSEESVPWLLHQLFGDGPQQPQVFLHESGMTGHNVDGVKLVSLQKSSLSLQSGLGGAGVGGEGAGLGGIGLGAGGGPDLVT